MAQYIDPNSGIGYDYEDPYVMSGGGTPPTDTGGFQGTSGTQNVAVDDPVVGGGGGGGYTPAQIAAVTGFYQKYLGRPPQPGDVERWLSGAYGWGDANNLAGIETGMRLSDEGAQYSSQHTTPANTQGTAAGAFQTTGNDYSAFDTARAQDPSKSAKDAFVMLSNQAPSPPMGNKAALAAWFTKYIAPGMNNLGYKVSNVNGDGFDFSGTQGNFHVDYAQGAGAPGARLQWNATPSDAATAAKYGETFGGGGAATGGGGGGGGVGGGGVGGGGGGAAAYGAGSSTSGFPTLDIPSYEDIYGDYVPEKWVPPDPNDVTKDPSYEFRYREGMKPLANSIAMSGMMKSGATAKALMKYGGNFASDEYDKIYGRARDTFNTNEGNRFNAFTTNKNFYNTGYGYDVDEAKGEYGAKFNTAKLGFDRDWDIYKFQNDDAFRYWNSKLGAATQGSQLGSND